MSALDWLLKQFPFTNIVLLLNCGMKINLGIILQKHQSTVEYNLQMYQCSVG